MTQFHEGQDVEVLAAHPAKFDKQRRKAKIVEIVPAVEGKNAVDDAILVEFPDGTRGVFDYAHIRAVTRFIEVPGTCMQQHDEYQE